VEKWGKAMIRGTSLKKRCQEGILLVAFDEIDAKDQWVSLGVWEVHFQAWPCGVRADGKLPSGRIFKLRSVCQAWRFRDQTSLRGGPISSPIQIDNQIPGPPV